MKSGRVNITKEQIAEFCRNRHIKKLAFFGSVLRDDFKNSSDIDILVDFDPKAKMDLIRMAEIEIELSKIIGRKVDLRTSQDLSEYFRDRVIEEAEVLYKRE